MFLTFIHDKYNSFTLFYKIQSNRNYRGNTPREGGRGLKYHPPDCYSKYTTFFILRQQQSATVPLQPSLFPTVTPCHESMTSLESVEPFKFLLINFRFKVHQR